MGLSGADVAAEEVILFKPGAAKMSVDGLDWNVEDAAAGSSEIRVVVAIRMEVDMLGVVLGRGVAELSLGRRFCRVHSLMGSASG